MRKLVAVVFWVLLSSSVGVLAQESLTITLLHTNDTHAHHLPDNNGNGGVERQASVVNQVRAEVPNVLLIDTGDRFSGTLFHTLYQGTDQVAVMNALGYDVMTLGNHEFDEGDEVLANFISALNFPVVVSNLTTTGSVLDGLIVPSAVLDVAGQSIGIVGLIVAETPELASPSPQLQFDMDYVGVVNRATEALTEQGINKIILLSHISYWETLAFMPELLHVDVVIGGDAHVFNSNTLQGAYDAYPVRAENASGEPIVYAQAGYYNLYMGRMDVTFDENGVLTSATGDTIWLNRYIPKEGSIAGIVADLYAGVEDMAETPIGAFSDVAIDGERAACRVEECAMGNLIADAFLYSTGAQIAFVNGGGVRSSFQPGEIKIGDVMSAQPFNNVVVYFDVSGAVVLEMLENGVSRITLNDKGEVTRFDTAGRFLQVAGLRYSYDPTQPVGQRVSDVFVQNGDGTESPLDVNALYKVTTNNFMYEGGDGFSMLPSQAINAVLDGGYDYEVLIDYLLFLGVVTDANIKADVPRITVVNAPLAPR